MVAKVVGGLTFSEKILRTVFLNYLPKSVIKNNLGKTSAYRPLANFLPQIPFRGTGPVLPQQPSVRYLEEQEKQNKNKSSSTAPNHDANNELLQELRLIRQQLEIQNQRIKDLESEKATSNPLWKGKAD